MNEENVTKIEDFRTIEGKKKEHSPKPIDYILAMPSLFAGYELTKSIFKEYGGLYHFGPIARLGSTGFSLWVGLSAFATTGRIITITRECIVEIINTIREDAHGDS